MSSSSCALSRPSKKTCLQDPEVVLMMRVKRDEPGAFAELVTHHGPRIFARFFRSFQDRQEAEDLTQEVLLRLYRSRQRYEPRAKFSTWLYHIAQNVARNAFRNRRRHACVRLNLAAAPEASAREPNAGLAIVERSEVACTVRAAVSGLAGRQRAALEMHQFQHRSYAEIA